MRHLVLLLLLLACVASLGLTLTVSTTARAPEGSVNPPAVLKRVPLFRSNQLHNIPPFVWPETEKELPPNPPVETITKLEEHSKVEEVTETTEKSSTVKPPEENVSTTTTATQVDTNQDSTPKSSTSRPISPTTPTTVLTTVKTFELPIPSRCPQITETADESTSDHSDKDQLLAMLDPTSSASAAQRGCRFFIMHELVERSTMLHKSDDAQATQQHFDEGKHLQAMLDECFKSCDKAYTAGTDLAKACASGCVKASAAIQAAKNPPTTGTAEDELEREEKPLQHRSFSIIVPIQAPDLADQSNSNGFPQTVPHAVRMMMAMMTQMAEHARQAMFSNQEDPFEAAGGHGKSISVSRSMSVMVSKDRDGHAKIMVVHSAPRVQVGQFSPPTIFDDEDDLVKDPFEDELAHASNVNNAAHSDDDESDNMFDTDNLRVRLFGHVSSSGTSKPSNNPHLLGENGHGVQRHNGKDAAHVYYYRSKLCYYLPRLFYLTLVILVLYLIFWLFCAVPAAFYGRSRSGSSHRRSSSHGGGGVAIIATNGGGKSKKFFFTKNQKYFQLNNNQKRLSTTSLPPPYPGYEADSCAEPLPEKQPLPPTTTTTEVKK